MSEKDEPARSWDAASRGRFVGFLGFALFILVFLLEVKAGVLLLAYYC